MASEVVDIRERIERVRAEMAGEVIAEEHDESIIETPSNENYSKTMLYWNNKWG